MATIGYDAGEPFHFNVFSILGILLVALGLSPLFGLSLALVSVPGVALLAISLGLLFTIQGLAD